MSRLRRSSPIARWLAVGLIAAYALDLIAGALGIAALLAGIVLLGTATFGYCPPYALLGIDTCGKRDSARS